MTSDDRTAVNDLIVVLGPSLAGADALPALINSLPPDLAAPVIIALPLDLTHITNLATLLSRYTPLIVQGVTEAADLAAGTILIVPAHRQAILAEGQLTIADGRDQATQSPLTAFLATLAASYGERLIVVLLNGTGSDGIAGAVEAKHAGGTIVVQTHSGPRYPAVLHTLPPLLIDSQAEIDKIGQLLHDLVTEVRLPGAGDTGDALQAILGVVRRHASIDFGLYKTSTIVRRIGRRMAVTHCTTMQTYAQYVRVHPREVGELVNSFLINVTQFFRDPEAFALLREAILPPLIETARQHDHVLRLWSAGCATGEEPYSLAMLLSDMLQTELPQWTIKIFATDVDEAAITFGRHGLYAEPLLRGVPDEYRERFFDQVEDGYRVTKALRQMVIFGQQDLSQSPPFPRIDLILCRNVLIYFTAELQDYVLRQFAFSLSVRKGYLFLGKAETVRPNHSYFDVIDKRWKLYRCSGEVPSLPQRIASSDPNVARLLPSREPTAAAKQPAREGEVVLVTVEVGQLRTFNDLLLRYLPTGIVVIDRSYRLLTTNVAARRLLGLRDAGSEQDFLHAVHGIPYTEVRTAIDTVFRERQTVYLPDIVLSANRSDNRPYLALSIIPMQIDGSPSDVALINVIDVTEQVQSRNAIEAAQAKQAELIAGLDAANRRLSELNQELLDANEELQVTNEEMVLSHEELQASIEEFEATNEELQATNEELETNNEELQATNEELQTTNEELRARTNELQDLALLVEGERTRFADMVELAPFSIIALRGPSLQIQAINPSYAHLLSGRQIYGRPFAEVAELLWIKDVAVLDAAQEVYRHGTGRTLPPRRILMPDDGGGVSERLLLYTLVPTHNAIGSIDGVIIYAEDMTVQRAREAEQERERLEVIFDNAQQVALGLYDAPTRQLIVATGRYLDVIAHQHRVAREEIIGHSWNDLSFVPGDQAASFWSKVLTTHSSVRLAPIQLTLDGDDHETVWDSSIIPISAAEQPGEVQFVLLSAVEITEQVRARQELERLDHLKDEFLSLASHELRTPLTPLMGYADIVTQMLKQQPIDDPNERQRIDRFTAQFTKQIERITRLVADLVDVGRLQNGKWTLQREPLDLQEVVLQAVTEARATYPGRAIQLEQPEAGTVLQVMGDAVRLHQVLSNLLGNALTYAPNSPTVNVCLEKVVDPERGRNLAMIEVQDYGPGIPAAALPLLFDRFFQVQRTDRPARSGLGLGLYIVRQIVEQHDGMIEVDSQEGKGTSFRVRLPLTN